MKVKFAGFGGSMEYPCYEDENGKLYFDTNCGRGKLELYSGAWRDKECGEICGEPNVRVEQPIECENLFRKHPREYDYMLLSRLKGDCEYFIRRNGKCSSLWSDIKTMLSKMEELLQSFSEEDKPEWLTDVDFENIKKQTMAVEIKSRMTHAVEEQADELDFYMGLLEEGFDIEKVREYLGDESAEHMKVFCEEHGLV